MKKIILFLLLSIAGYGQIVPTGQEQDFDYGIRNTASQLDDNAVFLTVQDATGVQGKSTSSVWAKKIYVDNADAKKQFLSTGLLKNGLLQANVNTTLFNITAGTGIISNFDNPDAPTSNIIIFPSFTGILSPYLTTSNITYVAINNVPAVVMQASPFTDSQRRDLIILGAIVHSNLSTINTINNISAPSNTDTNQLHDLMEAIGALNISGNKYSANGANLSLNKSAGDIFKLGINFANNWKDPHKLTIDAQTLLTLRYRTQNGTEGADVTVLNPAVYDLNNVLTAVPSNRFSIQTVTLFQSGITRVQYGQNTYATMAEAEAAINTRAYVVEPNIALNGIARAYIILKNSTTSLQNASDAKIVEAQKFGGSTSGGVALTNASIIAALGFTPENVANKQNSLAVDGTGVKYSTVDAVNSSEYAKNYASIPFLSKYNDDLQNSSILILGDSNYDTPDRMALPFLKSLIKEKNSRGIGYFSFNVNSENMGLNAHAYSGTWVNKDIFNNGKGLDGRSITSNVLTSEITITPNTSISADLAKIDNVRVFYLKGAACDLEYSVNAGAYTTVTLSTTPSNGLGAFDIPIPLSNTWNLKIRLKTGSVELLGAIASNDTDGGILMNKSAHWGAASSHYLSLSTQASWLSMLSTVNPEVLIIGLSTNEFNNGVPLTTTKANFTALISNIKGTLKSTAIYISIPPKSDDVIVPPTAVTAKMNSEMLINLAKDLKVGYVPIYDFWNKFENIYTDALYVDGVHYNATGAGINANILKKGIGLTSTDVSDSFYIGTTIIKNDRTSASQTLTGISIDGNSASTTLWGGRTASFGTLGATLDYVFGADASIGGAGRSFNPTQMQSWLGLGANAYTSISYLPLTGGTLTGKLNSIVSIADYAHSIINSSSSGYGLFIRSGNDLTPSLRINNAADSANAINLYGNGNADFAGIVTAPTATPGTNTTQIATTAFVQGEKALMVRKISTNTTLANTDNGTIILLTASCTVTLPNGLMNGFNCSFSTQTGVTMTYALGGSVVLINNTGTAMAQNLSHTIVNTGVSNEYLTAGSL